MDPLHIRVTPLGHGYVAECQTPRITACGSSPHEAAENARRTAVEVFEAFACPSDGLSVVVRIDASGSRR